jgi:hypothetical protein
VDDGLPHWMWGYQHHFAFEVKYLAKRVCMEIGAPFEPDVLLVGVRRDEDRPVQPVCLEPRDGLWSLEPFKDLEAQIAADIAKHPMQNMFYGDAPSMAEKPDNIRRMVIRDTVLERLKPDDDVRGVASFAGWPQPVGDHDVVTILQVPTGGLNLFPSLPLVDRDGEIYEIGFLRACLTGVLDAFRERLLLPDPGRSLGRGLDAGEVIARAAHSFGKSITGQVTDIYMGEDLFEAMNEIASLRYEGSEGLGRMIIIDPAVDPVEWVCKLADPVPIRDARWARKLLQMATADLPLVATTSVILGLGRRGPPANPGRRPLTAEFHGHQDWTLWCGEQPLLRAIRSKPRLPQEVVRPERFVDTAQRLFPATTVEQIERLWEVLRLQSRRPYGSLVIIAEDAADEASRLSGQATLIEPAPISDELLAQASRIDGAILIDPGGVCHAIGVVLDGPAREECTPARGGRYNSAIRYVTEPAAPRMAIVASDDRTVDVIPILKPRINRADLEKLVAQAEGVDVDTYHRPLNLLRGLRFYLSASQCGRINVVVERLRKAPYRGTEIRALPDAFEPDPAMNESYFL